MRSKLNAGERGGRWPGPFHVHVHVAPRWEDDGIRFSWLAKNPPREKLEEYDALIRARW